MKKNLIFKMLALVLLLLYFALRFSGVLGAESLVYFAIGVIFWVGSVILDRIDDLYK